MFENTSLHAEVRNPESYSEAAYEKYLFAAKDEIIANVRATLEHPSFDWVMCDLTGGIDSRMVVAAAVQLPISLMNKVRINSSTNFAGDFKIAAQIVNALGLKWNDIPRIEQAYDFGDQLHNLPQSANLGTHYMSPYMPEPAMMPSTCRLTGGVGEAISRNCFSWIDYSRNEEVILDRIGAVIDIRGSSDAGVAFDELKKQSVDKMPAHTLKERMDLHYLYFRNRHHFKGKYKATLQWTPLQSKFAFHCKRMYFSYSVDAKMQYDLMNLISPILSCLPYEGEVHNNNLRHFSDRLYRKGYPKVNITADATNMGAYEEISAQRPVTYIPDRESVRNAATALRKFYTSDDMLLSALKAILEYSIDFEDIGLPLYKYFSRDRHVNKYNYNYHVENMRINRILSAYFQIQLVGSENSLRHGEPPSLTELVA